MSVEGSSVRCLRTRVEQVCEGSVECVDASRESEVVKCVVCVANEYRKFSSKKQQSTFTPIIPCLRVPHNQIPINTSPSLVSCRGPPPSTSRVTAPPPHKAPSLPSPSRALSRQTAPPPADHALSSSALPHTC